MVGAGGPQRALLPLLVPKRASLYASAEQESSRTLLGLLTRVSADLLAR
jgi:hypothetical protein